MMIPEQPFQSLYDVSEDRLARAGMALVSEETAARVMDVEYRIGAGLPVSAAEYEAILYAIYASTSYVEYHRPSELTDCYAARSR